MKSQSGWQKTLVKVIVACIVALSVEMQISYVFCERALGDDNKLDV
jgi:hypothetical protein